MLSFLIDWMRASRPCVFLIGLYNNKVRQPNQAAKAYKICGYELYRTAKQRISQFR
jgi:hypothetical protein